MSKSKSIQINISNPCSQSWDTMLPDATGRHCDHCQKSVIDFTTWSNAALYNFFSQNTGHVCGRFLSTQVGQPIHIPYQPQSKLYRLTIALGLTLIFTQPVIVRAKNFPPLIEQVIINASADKNDTSGVTVSDTTAGNINGRVLDEKKEGMLYAIVQVYQNGIIKGGNVSDTAGYYTIRPLEAGNYDVLVLYTGYDSAMVKNVCIEAGKTTTLNIDLKERFNLAILGGPNVIIHKEPVKNKHRKKSAPAKQPDEIPK